MTTETERPQIPLDLEARVTTYGELLNRIALLQENLGRVERDIIEAMEARGATVLDHPYLDVKLERPTLYDRSLLHPLGELVPPDELAKAFTPAHEEVVTNQVPDKWDMRAVLAFRRYGDKVKAVINAASYPGAPSLKVVTKKVAQ